MLQIVAAMTMAVAAAAPADQSALSVAAPQWQADYGQALAATRDDARPLLVVIDGAQDRAADFGAGDVTAKLLAKYNLCRVDVTTKYGRRVADVFGAKQFPHVAIIDKSGAVVLHKQSGLLDSAAWLNTLVKHQSGERAAPIAHATYFRGEVQSTMPASSTPVSSGVSFDTFRSGSFNAMPSMPAVSSPSYCPSCQRQAQGY